MRERQTLVAAAVAAGHPTHPSQPIRLAAQVVQALLSSKFLTPTLRLSPVA